MERVLIAVLVAVGLYAARKFTKRVYALLAVIIIVLAVIALKHYNTL